MIRHAFVVAAATAFVLVAARPNFAAEKKQPKQPAVTVDQAGPDFAVQGEYQGRIDDDGEPHPVGVQVIAKGDGKFHAVGYPGGLPGDGWNGERKIAADGQRNDGVVVFTQKELKGTVNDGELIVEKSGQEIGRLKKVHRKSPTLGAKPPENAVVLFDGSSVERWKGGRLTDDGLLKEGTTSKPTFQSGTLHLEFRLCFMPYAGGQGRSNSGCYLQGRYEVQILDSFGLAGKHNECGGIYSVKDPDVNMCLPPLSWQTYDIDFTAARFENGEKVSNARMTVRHNGVTVHDDVEVPKSTTAAPLKEGPEPGPVYLQNHGNPLRFRNIWFVPRR